MTTENEERRLAMAEALLADFSDDPEVARLARAVAALFLAVGEEGEEGRRKLDLDACLAGLAIGVSAFVAATRGPQYSVLVAKLGAEALHTYPGSPLNTDTAAPARAH